MSPLAVEIPENEGPCAYGLLVERADEQPFGAQTLQTVFGQDADRRVGKKGSERLRQLADDGEVVLLGTLHLLPKLSERRFAPEVGVGQSAPGEDDVVSAEGCAIVPDHVLAQMKRVDASVGANLPAIGQVGQDRAVRAQPGEAREDKGGQVLVSVVEGGVQGVHAQGGSHYRLHVVPAGYRHLRP
jgi:hypothetical protein